MTDLIELKHKDWVVISAYYAMYQSALALLAKIGLESKNHATTAAILEYFFNEQINKALISAFNDIKTKKDKIDAVTINERFIDYLWKIKRARETVQYGISINFEETEIVISHTREFVSKIKVVINELNEELIKAINKEINNLEKEAALQ